MSSKLSSQLAQSASLNAALLVDRHRQRPPESYLFTGHGGPDLESIYAIAFNGLLQLSVLNPSLRDFESSLFSSAAKSIDRTLLGKEENVELDKQIDKLLTMLGPTYTTIYKVR